ncbi:MAG: 50S ribosomal protein L6 [Patescibacteria group bacterium]|jgi:large subunit ribosomal protein L6
MSRLGKLPIKLPAGVQVSLEQELVKFKGPKGELQLTKHPLIEIKLEADELLVTPYSQDDKESRSLWGLMWSLVNNSVLGVSEGFEKKLEVNGVGYRVTEAGNKLNLNLGYSHPIEFPLPTGISAQVEGNIITVRGIDKALVGEVAANIRKLRKPEPYKGKGIRYVDEVVRRKVGKTAAKSK